ncbi:AzlC family ABC transporter permease [Stomatohabitans albus]|uniref:AzlC family ABC transporter permease n=1 Tax=Stomatohabitans albus TaxID=3110766 RepID=UPI00300C9602
MASPSSSDTPTDFIRQEVCAAWKIAMPACIALIPLGLALGVLVVQAGLLWWWAPIFAAFVYAGSLEFLLVGMVTAAVPLSQIALTALLVNFRHVFYALTFPLKRIHRKHLKMYSTFTLTDEAYALMMPAHREGWSQTRIITIQVFLYIVWVGAVAAGALVGGFIPTWVVGLQFAVSALFIVLAVDAYAQRPSVPIPLVAIGCALIGAIFTPDSYLLTAIGLFVASLTGAYVLDRWRAQHGQ